MTDHLSANHHLEQPNNARVSENPSVISNSHSITVFADARELLTNDQPALTVPPPVFQDRKEAIGLNEYNAAQTPEKMSSLDSNNKDDWRSTISLVELFPEPPHQPFYHPKRLLSFKKLFPESRYMMSGAQTTPESQRNQVLNIDKSLPQPPYHVLGHRKKAWLVGLISLAGSLAPLSASMYFPALGQVAAVSSISILFGS